jgi:hypothetical protein
MTMDEVEVYVTPDGVYRAAIVRRSDGFFCIYRWCLGRGYVEGSLSESDLYGQYKEPLIGIYGTVDDARRELRSLDGFADASLMRPGPSSVAPRSAA